MPFLLMTFQNSSLPESHHLLFPHSDYCFPYLARWQRGPGSASSPRKGAGAKAGGLVCAAEHIPAGCCEEDSKTCCFLSPHTLVFGGVHASKE